MRNCGRTVYCYLKGLKGVISRDLWPLAIIFEKMRVFWHLTRDDQAICKKVTCNPKQGTLVDFGSKLSLVWAWRFPCKIGIHIIWFSIKHVNLLFKSHFFYIKNCKMNNPKYMHQEQWHFLIKIATNGYFNWQNSWKMLSLR